MFALLDTLGDYLLKAGSYERSKHIKITLHLISGYSKNTKTENSLH